MYLGKEREYKREITITDKPTKELDSETGEKLNRIYMKIVFTPNFKTSQESQVFYLNEESTPDHLKNHWTLFNERRLLAIENIKSKMARYFIQKTEIK